MRTTPFMRWMMLFGMTSIGPSLMAQTPDMKPPAYDVVSVKANKTGSGNTSVHINADRYLASNISLKSLLVDAYDLETDDLIYGLPVWAASAHFDVEGKMDEETIAKVKSAPMLEGREMRRRMLQTLLADRFRLTAHHETRELAIYALVVGRGSKVKIAAADDVRNGGFSSSNHALTANGIGMASLAAFLAGRLHRNVEDRTGLKGEYDFKLEWAPDEAAGESASLTGASPLPSLFTAMQEQLGLKLESTKGPVDVIVVDRIEQPTEN